MGAALIVVFREVLEMALITGILMAATVGVTKSRAHIGAGVVTGLAAAIGVALLAERIMALADGMGQELFNAIILIAAAAMIIWTVAWMSRHGREIAAAMKRTGDKVRAGEAPLIVLSAIVAIAVLREGAEVVLFLAGIVSGGQEGFASLLIGGLLGALLAMGMGAIGYLGLIRVPMGRLLSICGWLLTLLAAGMAAQAAGLLQSVALLPAWGNATVWNTSGWLPESGIVGQFLHILIGYEDRPTGMQLLVYLGVIAITVVLKHVLEKAAGTAPQRTA